MTAMDGQEVINALADIEQYFFYRKNNPGELEQFQSELVQMHREADALLTQWNRITGLKPD